MRYYQPMLIVLLLVLNMSSAVGVIYVKHLSRQAMSQLQSLEKTADLEQHRWTQLLLEQGTWANYSVIQQKAIDSLGMINPDPAKIFVLE